MEGFQVTEIGEKIYCILDAGNSSFYVVEGEEKAAVIDTGITAGAKILPVIRELTDKPLLLVITHAHPDHMYHIDEFDEVYMCHEEKKMDPETLTMLTAGKLKPWEEIHDIRTDSVISLGGTELAVCQTPGHTPGSVVVLETKQNYLFTGDAIGSGCGVWMQVPGGTSLEVLRFHALIFGESAMHSTAFLRGRTTRSGPVLSKTASHCLAVPGFRRGSPDPQGR